MNVRAWRFRRVLCFLVLSLLFEKLSCCMSISMAWVLNEHGSLDANIVANCAVSSGTEYNLDALGWFGVVELWA